MTEIGRETERLLNQAVKALERNAVATEKMLAIAEREQIQFEYSPPMCPHCGAVNPEVTQLNVEGSGLLGDFIMQAEAHCCNHVIYAIPLGFSSANDVEMAKDIQRQLKGGK